MSTQSPKISIIVPVYKVEQYLPKCIDSILSQTYQDWELLLINDGSPDNSGNICDEYAQKDERIRVFHKENGGASSARNIGLDNASGDFICFIDSDDIVEPSFLENFGDLDADIIVQGIYIKKYNDQEESYVGLKETFLKDTQVVEFMDILHNSQNTGYLFTRAFRRQIIKKMDLKLNEHFTLREDEEFIWRYMCECTSFKSVNKGAYHYDMPNFDEKYIIDWAEDFRCTSSIIDSTIKITSNYHHPIQINNMNRLARDIIKYYLDDKFESRKIKTFVDKYCNYINNGRLYSRLNKRNRFLFLCIGTRTPKLIHSVISKLLKIIYRLKN